MDGPRVCPGWRRSDTGPREGGHRPTGPVREGLDEMSRQRRSIDRLGQGEQHQIHRSG